MEGEREPIGRRAFRDHVLRDEARDRVVGHAADHGLHQLRPFVVLLLVQQAEHHVRRDLTDGRRHVAQHRLELLGIVLRHGVDDPAQHAHQRGGLRPDAGRCVHTLLELRHHFRQLVAVDRDAEELLDAFFIELERAALQAVRDDLVPDRGLAGARRLQSGDAAQRRGFAAPGRPQQHEKLAVPHLQRQVVKGGLPVGIERLGEPAQRDRGHRVTC